MNVSDESFEIFLDKTHAPKSPLVYRVICHEDEELRRKEEEKKMKTNMMGGGLTSLSIISEAIPLQ